MNHPISFHCPECGASWFNPAAMHSDDGFVSIHMHSQPSLCDGCKVKALAAASVRLGFHGGSPIDVEAIKIARDDLERAQTLKIRQELERAARRAKREKEE
jgi:hypothetical protein